MCKECAKERSKDGGDWKRARRGGVFAQLLDASADDACNFALVSVVSRVACERHAPHQEWIFPPSADVVAV